MIAVASEIPGTGRAVSPGHDPMTWPQQRTLPSSAKAQAKVVPMTTSTAASTPGTLAGARPLP